MVIFLVYLYVAGLLIANVYGIYRRALAMGVPRHLALWSFPFTFALFWFPGYFLSDKKRKVAAKNWYDKFINFT